MTVWLTRPQSDSERMAAELAAHQVDTFIAPVMHIAPCPYTLPSKPDALFITSRHAADALPADWSDLPVYCVGEATAEAMRARGYARCIVGTRDAIQLLAQVQEARLVYLSGEEVTVDVAGLLAARGTVVERVIVYEAVAHTQLPDALQQALASGALSGVVFFSARTAAITDHLLTQAGLSHHAARMDAFCLSLPVAQAAGALPWRRLHVSHLPTQASMVAMLAQQLRPVAS